ncbi:N-acetylmannosamine-6-phosphate 2-epimerase [Fusobacteria bacterium ZRK30]|nr:N-acetylmannosamine-6-phosphate 2-epimerase [Fusobacteria bacterium ZRK30]
MKKGLIVSCQALPSEPLYSSFIMGRMARAAAEGGASGIRANTVEDIKEIKKEVDLPIIGIIKKNYGECPVFITPTMKEVDELYREEVDIIAIDATKRERPDGISMEEFIKNIKNKYPDQLIMADISCAEEAVAATAAGVDIVGTTLVGYTEYTRGFVPLEELARVLDKVKVPVIAEGNIDTPSKVKKALELGASSVVVGSIITRPQFITKRFVEAIKEG